MNSAERKHGAAGKYESPRFRIVTPASDPKVTTTISSASPRPVDRPNPPRHWDWE